MPTTDWTDRPTRVGEAARTDTLEELEARAWAWSPTNMGVERTTDPEAIQDEYLTGHTPQWGVHVPAHPEDDLTVTIEYPVLQDADFPEVWG